MLEDDIICSFCSSTNVQMVTEIDDEGFAEFCCEDCGEYFVEEVAEIEAARADSSAGERGARE